MFSVGQKVWHRRGQPSGTVLECDGDRVYLQQDNGAEVDFPAADLCATPPEKAVPHIAHSKEGHVVPNRVITRRDITPESHDECSPAAGRRHGDAQADVGTERQCYFLR